MPNIEFCSFRDPAGVVLKHEGRIFRLIKREHSQDLLNLLTSPLLHELTKDRKIPASHCLSEDDFRTLSKKLQISHVDLPNYSCCIEHELIPFPSYPYEWAPEMLHSAASFTLDLAEKLLQRNLGLKDASPYNILFRGADPVFVDILSFETRDPHELIWLPYAQFVRTFLLPLIANQQCEIALSQLFLNKADGLEPDEVYRMLSMRKRLKPGILSLVTASAMLSKLPKGGAKESAVYQRKKSKSPEMAKFVLERMYKGLRKQLQRFAPVQKNSRWTNYFSAGESYDKKEFEIKSGIVSKLLQHAKPKSLLDIGCNTGYFSKMAAKQNAAVVALDSDPAVVGALWREAKDSNLNILPLVVDICRPSPAVGWRNAEQLSFLNRAQGAFDTVIMLAVLHHMTITARIPLEDVADLCSQLTSKNLIIEFVGPADPMFKRLLRGRDSLYSHLTQEHFEKVFKRYFRTLSCEQVGTASRWIYHLEKM